jgi:hypothetical protein
MGNLSSQYISQSFQSLLHLGSDNTASVTFAEIQDALGNGVGVFVNTTGNLRVTNAISASAVSASTISGFGNPVSYSASVSDQLRTLENITSSLINKTGSYATTGSNNFIGNQTISGDLDVSGQLRVSSIYTTQETASIIFSSGSNILGDSILDTQTLNGLVRVSGSSQITGSMGISANLEVKSAISSSTITGMGNVTNYSASVFNQIYALNQYDVNNDTKWSTLLPVTQSLINQVYSLELFTASAQTNLNQLNQASASTALTNPFTASVNTKFLTLASYTGSNDTKWTTLQSYTSSVNTKFTTLGNLTGSFATTGSNSFTGSQRITGSVYGNIIPLTYTGQTASVDMSKGNFFTLNVSGNTYISASNINLGQTSNLLLTQTATSGNVVFSTQFKLPGGFAFSSSLASGSQDIITFVAFTTSSLYTAYIKNLS